MLPEYINPAIYSAGPLGGVLIPWLGPRVVVMLGSALCTASLAASAFGQSVTYMTVTFGFFAGRR